MGKTLEREILVNDAVNTAVDSVRRAIWDDSRGVGKLTASESRLAWLRVIERLVQSSAMEWQAHVVAEWMDLGEHPRALPTYCYWCRATLMGGATKHQPGCEVLKMIEDAIKARDGDADAVDVITDWHDGAKCKPE